MHDATQLQLLPPPPEVQTYSTSDDPGLEPVPPVVTPVIQSACVSADCALYTSQEMGIPSDRGRILASGRWESQQAKKEGSDTPSSDW